MRKFRNSAIAIVSAAAITLGSVSAVSAQETPPADDTAVVTETPDDGIVDEVVTNGSSSSEWGKDYEADQPGYGTDGFGSSREDSGNDVPRWLSAWGKVFDVLTVGSILGVAVFPAVNWLKYNGIIK